MNELNFKVTWRMTEDLSPIDSTINALTHHINYADYEDNLDDIIARTTIRNIYSTHQKSRFWVSIHSELENKLLYGFTEVPTHPFIDMKVADRVRITNDIINHFVSDVLLRAWLDRSLE